MRPKYLSVRAHVRFWEDASVYDNAVMSLHMPYKIGNEWCPTIDIDTGHLLDWPQGLSGEFLFKICDGLKCELLDADRNVIAKHAGYVIDALCPSIDGGGDYINLRVDLDGRIDDWSWSMGGWNRV